MVDRVLKMRQFPELESGAKADAYSSAWPEAEELPKDGLELAIQEEEVSTSRKGRLAKAETLWGSMKK